jgi:hypothetical protein
MMPRPQGAASLQLSNLDLSGVGFIMGRQGVSMGRA